MSDEAISVLQEIASLLSAVRKEKPRNRQKPKRGCKRFFEEGLYKRRFTVECPFAWEE